MHYCPEVTFVPEPMLKWREKNLRTGVTENLRYLVMGQGELRAVHEDPQRFVLCPRTEGIRIFITSDLGSQRITVFEVYTDIPVRRQRNPYHTWQLTGLRKGKLAKPAENYITLE